MLSDSNKNKKSITYIEDIVKEICEETDLSYDQVFELCNLSLDYVKKATTKEEVLSILLPHLGTMYYSERIGEVYRNTMKNPKEGARGDWRRKTHDLLLNRKNLIKELEEKNEVKKSFHKRKPLLYKFKNIYKKLHNGTIVKGGATIGFRELWTRFSEIQNKIQNGEKY